MTTKHANEVCKIRDTFRELPDCVRPVSHVRPTCVPRAVDVRSTCGQPAIDAGSTCGRRWAGMVFMKVIGVVGGIASGKSLVCEQFASLGAVVVAADPMGHEALRDPAVRTRLVDRWGEEILAADGEVDRAAVARRVFQMDGANAEPSVEAKAELRFLESVVHPWIEERLRGRLEAVRVASPDAVVLLDAALLLEAGWDAWCDGVLFVDTIADRRRERALSRGWSVEQWRARESAQWPVEKKREVSRWTVDNSGSSAETNRQVRSLWRRLREEA